MNQSNVTKDYYGILGADEKSTQKDIERLYKRLAARHHPDRGGNEDAMKSLNEAYGVLGNEASRRLYDSQRSARPPAGFIPVSSPPPQDVGLLGHFLSSFLCILAGLFLLLLVRVQWIWFLWPLSILALIVLGFGILLARSALLAVSHSMFTTGRLRDYKQVRELVFWCLVAGAGYLVYFVLMVLE